MYLICTLQIYGNFLTWANLFHFFRYLYSFQISRISCRLEYTLSLAFDNATLFPFGTLQRYKNFLTWATFFLSVPIFF